MCAQDPPTPTVARAQQPLQLPQPSQAGYQQAFDLAQVQSPSHCCSSFVLSCYCCFVPVLLLFFSSCQCIAAGHHTVHHHHRTATQRQQLAAQCKTCCSQARPPPTRAHARHEGSSDCSSSRCRGRRRPPPPSRLSSRGRRRARLQPGRPPAGARCRTRASAAHARHPSNLQRPCHRPRPLRLATRGRSSSARLTCRGIPGSPISGGT